MSKKKSLGSSPIGYSSIGSSTSSFHFIPEIDIADKDEEEPFRPRRQISNLMKGDSLSKRDSREKTGDSSTKWNVPEKKITSYYLEVELVNRLKTMANDREVYYSSLANEAIQYWVEIHGY